MTPVYMNPSPSSSSSSFPLLEMKKDHQQSQLKIFLTSHQASATSKFLPCSSNQDQHASATLDKATAEHLMHGELSDRPDSISAASSSLQILSGPQGIHHLQGQDSINSSVLVSEARSPDHQQTHGDVDAKDIYGAKWMPSKMRFIQKMRSDSGFTTRGTTDEFSADNSNNNNLSEMGFSGSNASNSATRVCSDCNTTTTPLWRSGPRGPKSLCNACGIRRRKARRAMEEAANATVGAAGTATELSSPRANTKAGIYNKEKKPRPNHQHHHAPHYRKQAERCRPGMDINGSDTSFLHHGQKKLNLFKNLGIGLSENIGGSGFGRVFPQDETEAAIMLMELSCGLIHT